jgi:hypothetical protein
MTDNGEEKKDHVELTKESAQMWLNLRRYKAKGAELTEQELMQGSGGRGPPGTAGDGNGRLS